MSLKQTALGYQQRVKQLVQLRGETITFAAAGGIKAIPFVMGSTLVTEYLGSNPNINTIRPVVTLIMSPLLTVPTLSDTFTVPEYGSRVFTAEYLAPETIAGVQVVTILIAD